MSNIPHHVRASSSAPIPINTAPVKSGPHSPASSNPGNGSRPTVTRPQQVVPAPALPAGGYQQMQAASLRHEEHKQDFKASRAPLSASILPAGAFEPLRPGQSVESAVALILDRAQGAPAAMQAGFKELVSTRVAHGVEVQRVASALLQGIEAASVAAAKDSKQAVGAVGPDAALLAAMTALRSLPGVMMADVLRPLLAQTGRPDAVAQAWLLALADDRGEIHAAHWQTAVETLAGTASAAHKSSDWLGQGLEGLVSAAEHHMADASATVHQLEQHQRAQQVLNQNLSETLGTTVGPSAAEMRALGQARGRMSHAMRCPDAIAMALGAGVQVGIEPRLVAQAAARLGSLVQKYDDEPVKYRTEILKEAFKTGGASAEQIAGFAHLMLGADFAGASNEQRNRCLSAVIWAIDEIADHRFPPVKVEGRDERSPESIDAGRTIKRMMLDLLKAPAKLATSASEEPAVAGGKGPLNG